MNRIKIDQNNDANRSGIGPQHMQLLITDNSYHLLSVDDCAPIWLTDSQLEGLAKAILEHLDLLPTHN